MDSDSAFLIIKAMMTEAQKYQTNLVPFGLSALGLAVGLVLSWSFAIGAIKGDMSEFWVTLMQTMLTSTIALTLLGTWSTLGTEFSEGMASVAQDAAGGGTISAVSLATKNLLGAIGDLLQFTPTAPETKCAVSLGGTCFLTETPTGFFNSLGVWLASLPMLLLGLIARIIAVLILAAAFFLYLITLMMGELYMALGVIIGPLVIWTIVMPPLTSYFYSWLKFMLGAGLVQVVGFLILTIAAPATAIIKVIAQKVASNSTDASSFIAADIMGSIGVAISALVVFTAIKQTSSIANGILSGGGSFTASTGGSTIARMAMRKFSGGASGGSSGKGGSGVTPTANSAGPVDGRISNIGSNAYQPSRKGPTDYGPQMPPSVAQSRAAAPEAAQAAAQRTAASIGPQMPSNVLHERKAESIKANIDRQTPT